MKYKLQTQTFESYVSTGNMKSPDGIQMVYPKMLIAPNNK